MARLPTNIDQRLIAELKLGLSERVRTRLQEATDRIVDAKRSGGKVAVVVGILIFRNLPAFRISLRLFESGDYFVDYFPWSQRKSFETPRFISIDVHDYPTLYGFSVHLQTFRAN